MVWWERVLVVLGLGAVAVVALALIMVVVWWVILQLIVHA